MDIYGYNLKIKGTRFCGIITAESITTAIKKVTKEYGTDISEINIQNFGDHAPLTYEVFGNLSFDINSNDI